MRTSSTTTRIFFDDDAIETFAKYDAQLDYGYGSILGLVSTDSLDGKSMEDYAMDASADLELGDSDMLLLIDTDTEQWYLAYGGDMADYVDNDLSILFRQNLGSLFTGSAEKSVTGLYQDLLGWYAENIPAASGNAVQPEPAYVQKEESGIDLFGILITILVIVILFKIIFRPRRRYYDDGVYYGGGPRPGFWSGMFWGSMLGRNRGHRPPPPGPRPGYRPPSAGPRPGGFHTRPGGSGFKPSSRGFGGGSRGGGFRWSRRRIWRRQPGRRLRRRSQITKHGSAPLCLRGADFLKNSPVCFARGGSYYCCKPKRRSLLWILHTRQTRQLNVTSSPAATTATARTTARSTT